MAVNIEILKGHRVGSRLDPDIAEQLGTLTRNACKGEAGIRREEVANVRAAVKAARLAGGQVIGQVLNGRIRSRGRAGVRVASGRRRVLVAGGCAAVGGAGGD